MVPTLDEMKILADQFVQASIEYVIAPSQEKLDEATSMRITLHAGLALLVNAANAARTHQ